MTRRYQTLILWSLWAWVVMTLTHELGHVIGGVLSGATVSRLELRPWHLPHSLYLHDKHPMVTLWAGPVLSCVVPIAAAMLIRRPAIWFIAWFSLLANAAYLILGYFAGDAELDSSKMVDAGTHPMALIAISAIPLVVGYVGFRKSCIDLMSGETETMTSRNYWISAVSLAAVLVLQGAIGHFLVTR